MQETVMRIADLKEPERNVRIHTDKQLKEFEKSIRMFGQLRPIVIDENNMILAGNGLYMTLKRMEMFADAEELTEQLSTYGTLAPEEVEGIRAQTRREEAREGAAPGSTVNSQASGQSESVPVQPSADQERAETRRFVVCPKCGETIWL